jgi:hypothetical protein
MKKIICHKSTKAQKRKHEKRIFTADLSNITADRVAEDAKNRHR